MSKISSRGPTMPEVLGLHLHVESIASLTAAHQCGAEGLTCVQISAAVPGHTQFKERSHMRKDITGVVSMVSKDDYISSRGPTRPGVPG